MASQDVQIITHADHPEWGRGVILPVQGGRADRIDISFEMGGRRTILRTFATKLKPVAMAADEAKLLGDRLASRRSASGPVKTSSKKKPKGAVAAVSFPTFEAQLAAFETAYPGGFRGEAFERDVRGLPDAKRKKSDTGPALAEAAKSLGKQAFESQDANALFEAAASLVKNTAFVHPLEGANLLGALKEEQRPAFVAALRDLLHGTDEEADRFDRFVSAIKLDGDKRPTWPLVTIFAALVHPTRHVCVKPTAFQKQAALLRVALDYQPLPTSTVYDRFLATVRKTEEALKNAGQSPRDLVDVASFIGVTQSAKTPAAK